LAESTPAELIGVRRAYDGRVVAAANADRELAEAVDAAVAAGASVTAIAAEIGWTRRSVYLLLERNSDHHK
jgi:ABC-type transporter Mla maintaining outer membrane lipid asymmetry permease subunit MlaE